MSGGVPKEREEDQTDERLRNTEALARLVNRRDEEVGTKGGKESDSEEGDNGRPKAHGRLLLLLLALLSDEQLGVRLELEVQVREVDDEQDDRSSPVQTNQISLLCTERGGGRRDGMKTDLESRRRPDPGTSGFSAKSEAPLSMISEALMRARDEWNAAGITSTMHESVIREAILSTPKIHRRQLMRRE